MFRDLLESALLNTDKKSNAGAKPYDVVMLFIIIILQLYYGLGDQQVEYQILDRLSFKTFLGLASGDKTPDEKTIWSFRERLTNQNIVEELFSQFNTFLEDKNLIFNEGQLIDASFTVAPRQRNNREENKKIKVGFMEQSMNGLVLRSVGIKRAKGIIGLINFTYNLFRYEQVVRLNIV